MRLLPAAGRPSAPWKNGRGRTAVVADGDGWRVSIAELQDGSPFSSFPGAGRLFMPLSGTGVVLSVNGHTRTCEPFRACRFEGEDTVFASEVTAPIEVLNLIWRRDSRRGAMSAVTIAGPLQLRSAEVALLAIVAAGTMATPDGAALDRLDGLMVTDGEPVTVSGSGQLALVCVEQARSAGTT